MWLKSASYCSRFTSHLVDQDPNQPFSFLVNLSYIISKSPLLFASVTVGMLHQCYHCHLQLECTKHLLRAVHHTKPYMFYAISSFQKTKGLYDMELILLMRILRNKVSSL